MRVYANHSSLKSGNELRPFLSLLRATITGRPGGRAKPRQTKAAYRSSNTLKTGRAMTGRKNRRAMPGERHALLEPFQSVCLAPEVVISCGVGAQQPPTGAAPRPRSSAICRAPESTRRAKMEKCAPRHRWWTTPLPQDILSNCTVAAHAAPAFRTQKGQSL